MPGTCTCPSSHGAAVRRIPIRMKLAGALAVPLLALVVVTVLEVVQSARDADEAREQRALAEATIGPSACSAPSRTSATRPPSTCSTPSRRSPSRSRTTPRRGRTPTTRSRTCGPRWQDLGGAVRTAYQPSLDRLGELDDVRTDIDAFTGERGLVQHRSRSPSTSTATPRSWTTSSRPTSASRWPSTTPSSGAAPSSSTSAAARRTSSPSSCAICCSPRSAATAPTGSTPPQEISAIAASAQRAARQRGAHRHQGDRRIPPDGRRPVRRPRDRRLPAGGRRRAGVSGHADLDAVVTNSAGEDPETYGYTVFRESVTTP